MPDAVKASGGSDLTWRGEVISRMVLGTVQLGLNYGIANTAGKPSAQASRAIVEAAWAGGVRFFDTAQGYGDSEARLGDTLESIGIAKEVSIITKINPRLDPLDSRAILNSIEQSLEKMRQSTIWGVMLHRPQWMEQWDDVLGQSLRDARRHGWLRFLGVSVYNPDEAIRALGHPDFDVVQVPGNAWDDRILTCGVIDEARRRGKLIFVRSVYLQGLMTLSPADVAKRLPFATPAAQMWEDLSRQIGVSPRALAMRFALSFDCPLVIGAEHTDQVRDNAVLVNLAPLTIEERAWVHHSMAPLLNEQIINPSLWKNSP